MSHESYRRVVDAKRPSEFGGGLCNLLIRRVNNHVELLFHADPRTGAILTQELAVELAQPLQRLLEPNMHRISATSSHHCWNDQPLLQELRGHNGQPSPRHPV